MHLYRISPQMYSISILLMMQTVSGNYLGSQDSLQSEISNEDLIDSNLEDVNWLDDYSDELPPPDHRKSKEWVNVTMSQGSYSLMSGQSYELKCEAAGAPAPEVYWFRGNAIQRQINKLRRRMRTSSSFNKQTQDMAKVESKYIINCASEEDVGPIHCVAISGRFFEKKSAIITLEGPLLRKGTCNMAQSPIITRFKPTLLNVQGSTVILPCDVSGDPKPRTFWKIEGDNGAMDVRNDARIGFLRDGGLMIKSLEWSDLGEYTCIANSTLGEDRATTFVYPLRPSI